MVARYNLHVTRDEATLYKSLSNKIKDMKHYHTTDGVPIFFFFQAEDGIRDLTVTGVQTCALPILGDDLSTLSSCKSANPPRLVDRQEHAHPVALPPRRRLFRLENLKGRGDLKKIGRASCRERV